jgi:hypothetical protein
MASWDTRRITGELPIRVPAEPPPRRLLVSAGDPEWARMLKRVATLLRRLA